MELLEALVEEVRQVTRGEPVAVAFSGGLDSSVAAALCREALGPDGVLLVTVNMGQYAYRRGNEIVLEMAERLGLQQCPSRQRCCSWGCSSAACWGRPCRTASWQGAPPATGAPGRSSWGW
ncbi:MAG: hypothetical protein C4303_04645 [candidate division GAL15 bacterium]